jgi:uncharacterized membrane protein
MKRVNIFLAILIASIAALIASTVIGFAVFSTNQTTQNWMSQMWNGMHSGGGMMGGQTGTTSTNTLLPYFGVLFAILIAVTIIGVLGVGYYLLYPQIRTSPVETPVALTQLANGSSAYESVTKTLTEEERKVIAVLNTHQGKYLQKYIKSETGLSRLKTHRIIARLADRGIVSLEKTGNTNQVYLADWLSQQKK